LFLVVKNDKIYKIKLQGGEMKLFKKIGFLLVIGLFACSLMGIQDAEAKDKCY